VSIVFIFSRTSADLIRIPIEAAKPVPTITAVGVARPRAQGQAITRVEIPKSNENSNLETFGLSRRLKLSSTSL